MYIYFSWKPSSFKKRRLKYWKAPRLLGSVYPTSNKNPKISAHQELHHHTLVHPPPALPEVLTDLSVTFVLICQHTEKKMWDFKQLVSKQHQQMNSELGLKRWLICRVKARSDHWPGKKKISHISFLFLTIPRIPWDWTGIWRVNQGGGKLIQICLSKILELKVIGHLFLLRSPELFISYFTPPPVLRSDGLMKLQFLILF